MTLKILGNLITCKRKEKNRINNKNKQISVRLVIFLFIGQIWQLLWNDSAGPGWCIAIALSNRIYTNLEFQSKIVLTHTTNPKFIKMITYSIGVSRSIAHWTWISLWNDSKRACRSFHPFNPTSIAKKLFLKSIQAVHSKKIQKSLPWLFNKKCKWSMVVTQTKIILNSQFGHFFATNINILWNFPNKQIQIQ